MPDCEVSITGIGKKKGIVGSSPNKTHRIFTDAGIVFNPCLTFANPRLKISASDRGERTLYGSGLGRGCGSLPFLLLFPDEVFFDEVE